MSKYYIKVIMSKYYIMQLRFVFNIICYVLMVMLKRILLVQKI